MDRSETRPQTLDGGLDGPLHDWRALDEDGLRSYAAQHVGWATDEMADPTDLSWTLDDGFDLGVFERLATDWGAYRQEEVVENPRYPDGFPEKAYHSPIVVSIEHGEPIIWDGWHRIACAIARGDHAIMAIVGREPG